MIHFSRFLPALCIALLATLVTSCAPKTVQWNQKITMYIDTPDGQIMAASVVNVKYTAAVKWAKGLDGANIDTIGEATVADLGEGRFVFALLPEYGTTLAMAVYPRKRETRAPIDWVRHLAKQRDARDIPVDKYPMLVSFKDIADPSSVYEVNADSFAANFGEGYRLSRMTFQVTDEVVTEGVVERILNLWVGIDLQKTQLDGDRYHRTNAKNRLANNLNILDFIRGK